MSRTSSELTQAEYAAYEQFAKKHNVIMDENQDGYANAQFIADYFLNQWKQDMTVENLEAAFDTLKPYLKFQTPAQLVAKQAGIDQAQAEMLVSVLGRRQLDQRYIVEDAVTVAKYILAQGWALGPYSIDLCLSNLGNKPGDAKVHWVRKLQDREREEVARREANRQPGEVRISDDDVPSYVPANLRDHWRKMHAGETKAQATASTAPAYYEKLARDAAASITSNVDRDEATAQFLSKGGKAWPWELTYRTIMNYIERRRSERANARPNAR